MKLGDTVIYNSGADGAPDLPAIVTGHSKDGPDLAVFTHDGQFGVAGCPKANVRPKDAAAPKAKKGK